MVMRVFMKQCFDENEIENINAYQSLRMSGILYLIGEVSNCAVFDKEKNSYDEDVLLNVLSNVKLPSQLIDRWQHYNRKNKTEKTRYAEGLFYDIYLSFINKNINEKTFLKKVSDLFFNEIKYLKRVNRTSDVKFNFPVVEKIKDKEKVLQQIRKETISTIRMTSQKDFFCFKNKKALYLNEDEKSEGIFIAGSCGSGKTMASLSLFSQIIIKGGGGLYLTHDHVSHWYIASALKEAGREDDLLVYNINCINDFLTLDIPSLVKHNKVIVFYMYALEKDPWSKETLEFIDGLHQFLFLKFQEVDALSSNKHFMVVFEELLPYFFRNNKEMFILFNDVLERKNIIRVYHQQDMDYAERSLPFITHYFMMKQEDPCCKFIVPLLDRDLRMLNPGEFFYTKNLKDMNKNLSFHRFMYLNFNKIENFYINMF